MQSPHHPSLRLHRAAACLLLMGVAACGASTTSNSSAASAAPAAGTMPASWKATDACATMDKAVVAATLGASVTSTHLGAVKDQGGGLPLYSQCEFMLDDGRMLVFGTGQYTNGMNLAEQVADMRRQAAMISNSAPADFAGVGKAGLWAADVHALYAFFGDGRFVSATLTQTNFRKPQEAIEKVRSEEVSILHKAGA